MADKTPEQIAAEQKAAQEKAAAELEQNKQKEKVEKLREVSKKHGFNAFEPDELDKRLTEFKEWKESQMTEQEKLMARVNEYEQKESSWQQTQKQYEAKMQAMTLGIAEDKLNDALLLAGNDPSKLQEVIKKYPTFASVKDVNIGLQNGQHDNPGAQTEVEQYLKNKYKDSRYYNK